MRIIVTAMLMATVVACGERSSSVTDPTGVTTIPPSFVGTLALRSVNFDGLPTTIVQQTGDAIVITDGQMVVNQDQTYSLRVNFTVTQSGVMSTQQWNSSGTYRLLMVLGKPMLSFVDSNDSILLSNFTGDASGVSGTARPPTSIVPNRSDGLPILVAFNFSK